MTWKISSVLVLVYIVAAEASGAGGNEQAKIEALNFEAVLLFQQGEKEKHCRSTRHCCHWRRLPRMYGSNSFWI